jgi:uncharacterized membrane protein
MPALLAILATLASGLFAGAAVYISLVEHPARVGCGPTVAVRQFRPSYQRAAVVQVALALVGTVAALARFAGGGRTGWLVGGLLLVSVIPFTLVVIMPTNKRLLDESLDPQSADVPALLTRWGRLHAVRGAASLAAFIIFLALLPLS